MPNWKKVIVSGSDAQLNSVYTTTFVSSSYLDLFPTLDSNAPAHKEGRIWFDTEAGTAVIYNSEPDVSLQVGQEEWAKVYNNTGATLLNGTPVYISGSQGDMPYVWNAIAEDHTGAPQFDNHIFGVATHDISNNQSGFITTFGIVRGVDTTTFAAGDILYVETGSGGFRNTPPPFPYDIIQVGFVVRSHSNGFVFVAPREPVHFSLISGLSGSFQPDAGDLWVYQSNNAWTHTKTLTGSYTIQGDLTVTGDLFATASNAITASYIDGGFY